jgi:hypothetical protein
VEGAEFVGVLGCDGVENGAGLVGAAVVDGDDLEIGIVLREEGEESGGDVGGLVAGGDDDGDRRAAFGCDVVLG